MKAYVWPVDGTPPPTTTPSRWRRFVERHLPRVVIYLMVATLVAVGVYPPLVIKGSSRPVRGLWGRLCGRPQLDPPQIENDGFYLLFHPAMGGLYPLRPP